MLLLGHLAGIVDKSMDIIKSCDISENSTAMVTEVKDCKAAFGKCRKYEDDVADIVYVCGKTMTTTGPTTTQSLASLNEALNKAKADKESALKEIAAANLAIKAASEASTKLDTLDLQKFSSKRFRREDSSNTTQAVPTTCASVLTLMDDIITKLTNNPADVTTLITTLL